MTACVMLTPESQNSDHSAPDYPVCEVGEITQMSSKSVKQAWVAACLSIVSVVGTCTAVASTVRSSGQAARKLCVGHSEGLVDEMYGVMVSGEKFVDVTSLQPPDGHYLAAMRNAITYLSRKASPPRVRLLFGA